MVCFILFYLFFECFLRAERGAGDVQIIKQPDGEVRVFMFTHDGVQLMSHFSLFLSVSISLYSIIAFSISRF